MHVPFTDICILIFNDREKDSAKPSKIFLSVKFWVLVRDIFLDEKREVKQ